MRRSFNSGAFLCDYVFLERWGYFMSKSLDTGKIMFQNYPDVADVNGLSLMLGISRKLAYRLVAQGNIGSIKIG